MLRCVTRRLTNPPVHRWALTGAVIGPVASAKLEEFVNKNGLHSRVWLTEQHGEIVGCPPSRFLARRRTSLAMRGGILRDSEEAQNLEQVNEGVLIEKELLAPTARNLTPLAAVDKRSQRRYLQNQLPEDQVNRCVITDHSKDDLMPTEPLHNCSPTIPLTHMTNAEARRISQACNPLYLDSETDEWYLVTDEDTKIYSTFFPSARELNVPPQIRRLFLDGDLYDSDEQRETFDCPGCIQVFNAQETLTPFKIDPTLRHRWLLSQEDVEDVQAASLLTTVMTQHSYSSAQWVKAADLESLAKTNTCHIKPKENAIPHTMLFPTFNRCICLADLPPHLLQRAYFLVPKWLKKEPRGSAVCGTLEEKPRFWKAIDQRVAKQFGWSKNALRIPSDLSAQMLRDEATMMEQLPKYLYITPKALLDYVMNESSSSSQDAAAQKLEILPRDLMTLVEKVKPLPSVHPTKVYNFEQLIFEQPEGSLPQHQESSSQVPIQAEASMIG